MPPPHQEARRLEPPEKENSSPAQDEPDDLDNSPVKTGVKPTVLSLIKPCSEQYSSKVTKLGISKSYSQISSKKLVSRCGKIQVIITPENTRAADEVTRQDNSRTWDCDSASKNRDNNIIGQKCRQHRRGSVAQSLIKSIYCPEMTRLTHYVTVARWDANMKRLHWMHARSTWRWFMATSLWKTIAKGSTYT